jgi:hypothetical protein
VWEGGARNRGSIPGQGKEFRPFMRPIQHSIHWIPRGWEGWGLTAQAKRPGRETDKAIPSAVVQCVDFTCAFPYDYNSV